MDQNKIKDFTKTVEGFELPAYRDIPDVGLFLEQVVRYISKFTDAASLQPLTGSMVSNYVKKRIISNPVKKMYTRDQIAYLIFIAFTKNSVQIEDMPMLFAIQQESFDNEEAYEFFRREMQESLLEIFELGLEDKKKRKTGADASASKSSASSKKLFDHRSLLKNICDAVAQRIYLDNCIRMYREEMTGTSGKKNSEE